METTVAPDTASAPHRVAVIANMLKMGEKDAQALRSALESRGAADLDWIEVEQPPDVKRSVDRAIGEGARTVVVCGGDGTVRLAAEALVGTGVAIAVVPQGTGNIFVSALGLPTDLDGIAKSVMSGGRRMIDTGVCNGSAFNLTAGSGFDVGVMAPSDEEKKRHGLLAYVRAAFSEMLHRRPFDVEVLVDDSAFYAGPSTGVLIGNLGTQFAGVKAFPDASPTDGWLQVAVVTAVGPWNWMRLAVGALLRRPWDSGQAHVTQGVRARVTFHRRRRYELDGDVLGRTDSLTCEVKPLSLVVCTPAAADERTA